MNTRDSRSPSWYDRLRGVHWSTPRVLAVLFGGLGFWGVVQAPLQLARAFTSKSLANPVFESDQRLGPAGPLAELVAAYPANFWTIVGFSVFLTLLAIHFLDVSRRLYPRAPLSSLLAGLFLGASIVMGLMLGLTVLKVSEFAVQAASATAEQQTWLHEGVGFLIQLHLVFVYGWFLFTGLGWLFLGSGSLSGNSAIRRGGVLAIVAGAMVIAGVGARFWLPSYGALAPPLVIASAQHLFEIGMALGFLASGLLGWMLGNLGEGSMATEVQQGVRA